MLFSASSVGKKGFVWKFVYKVTGFDLLRKFAGKWEMSATEIMDTLSEARREDAFVCSGRKVLKERG